MTGPQDAGSDGSENDEPDALPTSEPVIETFERFAERYGLNRSCGRIYGICCFAAEPQSHDDLVSASGYAKSTVSTATQTLTRLSLLSRRSGRDGSQRVSFRAETDITAVVQDLLARRVGRDFRELRAAIEEGRHSRGATEGQDGSEVDGYPGSSPDDLQSDIERLEALIEWIAELSDDDIDSLGGDPTEEGKEERRRSPGFFPRLGR